MKLFFAQIAILIFFALFPGKARAQKSGVQCTDEYCVPSVIGLPRSKGFSIEYDIIPEHKITSTAKQSGYANAYGEVSKNSRLDIKLRLPIINKPALTVAVGFRFFKEEFYFTEPSVPNYELYTDLQDRSLRTAGLQLYIVKPTKTKKYFLLRMSADLNGDFTNTKIPINKYLKFSVAPMIGWKQNPNLSLALGLAYGYTFGRPTIYPIILLQSQFQ
jgi:hypothetical protein